MCVHLVCGVHNGHAHLLLPQMLQTDQSYILHNMYHLSLGVVVWHVMHSIAGVELCEACVQPV